MSDDKRDDKDLDDATDNEWNPWLEDEDGKDYAEGDGDGPLDFEDDSPFDDDDWQEPSPDTRPDEAPGRFTDTWPLGLIAVAAIALILLAAGGYGIMKQRSALEQTIRDLQAQLAVAGDPGEIASARASLSAAREENRDLTSRLDNLDDDNRQLRDTLAGLEQQLLAQQEAAAQAKPRATPAAVQDTPPPTSALPISNTRWFVNFSSYTDRDLAQQWASRLKPAKGEVEVSSTERDGRTFYRVRVASLATEAEARSVAQQLERDYELEKLWVGSN